MLFWRMLSFGFLLTGIFLFIQSLIDTNIHLFYWAFACYALASLIWLTIQKLYVEPFTPNKNRQTDDSWVSAGINFIDLIDIILSLPKFIFHFLIGLVHHLD